MERLLENEEGQPMTIRESSSHLQLLVNIGDGIGGMGILGLSREAIAASLWLKTFVLCLFDK